MAPMVQTFVWRLLRRAIPTGKNANRFSKHISENCARCGNIEDEMHILFFALSQKLLGFPLLGILKLRYLLKITIQLHKC